MVGCLSLSLVSLVPPVQAQTDVVAIAACQQFARDLYRDIKEIRQVQLVDDQKTRIYRFDDRIGSQYIKSELLGTGRLLTPKGFRNFSYLCLLENEQKALYFRILTNISF
jgi:hypothetical protein